MKRGHLSIFHSNLYTTVRDDLDTFVDEYTITDNVDSDGNDTDFEASSGRDYIRHAYHSEDALESDTCLEELCYLPQHTANMMFSALPQFETIRSTCAVCKSYVSHIYY